MSIPGSCLLYIDSGQLQQSHLRFPLTKHPVSSTDIAAPDFNSTLALSNPQVHRTNKQSIKMVDTSGAVRRGHPIFFVTLLITSFIGAVIASTLITHYHKNDPSVSVGLRDKVAFSVFSNWWLFLFSAVFVSFLMLFRMRVSCVLTWTLLPSLNSSAPSSLVLAES